MSMSEEKIRKWVNTILKEDKDIITENWGPIYSPQESYKMFVEPFADVFSMAKIGLTDVLSSAKLNLDVFLSISPKAWKEAESKWESRNQKIESKYSELLKKIDDDAGADANLFAFLVNPAGFLAFKATQAAVGTGGIPTFLDDIGLTVPGLAAIGLGTGGSAAGTADSGSGSADGKDKGILAKLKGIFFLPEGFNYDLEILTEDEKKETNNDVAIIEKRLQELGILDEISKDAKELIDAKKDVIGDLVPEVQKRSSVMTPLYNASSPEEFKKALDNAQASGLEMSGLEKIGKELDNSVEKILKDEKAIEKIKEKSKDDMSPEKIRSEVEKAVFSNSIQSLREKIFSSMNDLVQNAKNIISLGIPTDSYSSLMSQTNLGKELSGLLSAASTSISSK